MADGLSNSYTERTFSKPGAEAHLGSRRRRPARHPDAGVLRRIETVLRMRHAKDPGFRLCHYFDLIAGTSTGAIIAAALALGMTVAEVIGHYQKLGREVFLKGWFREGIVRARYDENKLTAHLKRVFGKDRTLGDESLLTGLLVMTKRLDTGSPWPLGNNPRGRYFKAEQADTWI